MMERLGDIFKKRAAPVEHDAEEEARRRAISPAFGDHYRDRAKRLEEASKKNTKSGLPVRIPEPIIGERG